MEKQATTTKPRNTFQSKKERRYYNIRNTSRKRCESTRRIQNTNQNASIRNRQVPKKNHHTHVKKCIINIDQSPRNELRIYFILLNFLI